MKAAFLDTSALAAILFDEPASSRIRDVLSQFGSVHASGLLEAEIRSAAARENVNQSDVDAVLTPVKWVLPDRPLSQELRPVILSGYPLRGADAWHIACALYLAGDPSALPFITLDGDQAQVAARVGFKVLPGASPFGSAREPQAAYKTGKSRAKSGKRKTKVS